jgi:hypothetical protein
MDTRATDFHFFLKSIGQKFSSISIFNSEFKCLHISTPVATNSVGLMLGLKTLKNFFSWEDSQIVIHNDPQLGCSRSDRIQFLFSVESFHFCIEESYCLPWDFSKKIIKIPPIPIVENNRTNSDIINALTGQTDCPSGMGQFFVSTLQKIEAFKAEYKNIIKANSNFQNKDLHKDFLNASAAFTLKTIKSKTYSSSNLEYEFASGSFLKLKTSTSELGIRVDFQGTTNHPSLQIPDSITDSVCFQFFADYFQFADLMNEATYSHFQIAKPTQSFVNSKIFTNKVYSDLSGPDLLNQALLDSSTERTNLKPYLISKPHFQLMNSDNNQVLEVSISNAKPLGSMGVAYSFEPLLSSRPTPDGHNVPRFADFQKFGLEVILSQQVFRSPKAKEINDFQVNLNLKCFKALQIALANPSFPTKQKQGKFKTIIHKPSITINGKECTELSSIQNLNPGDILEFKSGNIEYT